MATAGQYFLHGSDDSKQVLQDVVNSSRETVTRQVRRRVDFILISFSVFT